MGLRVSLVELSGEIRIMSCSDCHAQTKHIETKNGGFFCVITPAVKLEELSGSDIAIDETGEVYFGYYNHAETTKDVYRLHNVSCKRRSAGY